jgi:hypothetical protein
MPPPRHQVDRNGRDYLIVDVRWTKEAPIRELEAAGHVYRINGGALRELGGTNLRRTRLARPADGVLMIVPSVSAWAGGALSAAIGVGAPAGWFVYIAQHEWAPETARRVLQAVLVTLLLWGLGVAFASGALMLLTDRSRFDRNAGRAAWWHGLRKVWDVDLGEVVAVQCLHAGWFNHVKGGWHDTYQVNLVLRTGDGDRLQVCSEGDGQRAGEWVRSLAQALAAFLRVPLVDQIDETWVPQPRASWWE